MWSVDRESLRTIERKLGAEAKLELRYKSDQAVEWIEDGRLVVAGPFSSPVGSEPV